MTRLLSAGLVLAILVGSGCSAATRPAASGAAATCPRDGDSQDERTR